MRKFLAEFRDFALRGNIVSMAVGVLIGVSFQGLVTSLTDNIISPVIGIFARQNFDDLEWEIFGATLRYGAFVTSVINFVILAFVVFLMMRSMTCVMTVCKKAEAEKPPAPTCPFCLSEVKANATRCPYCTSGIPETK